MNKILIELPIDFGHTQEGKYSPQGQSNAPQLLNRFFQEELNITSLPTLKIPILSPHREETRESPMKFDREMHNAISSATGAILRRIKDNQFPVILGGDHSVSLATVCALSQILKGKTKIGAIVFDAHTDFNLPGKVVPKEKKENIPPGFTISGNIHGMVHSLLGRLVESPSFRISKYCNKYSRLDPSRIALLGVRSKQYPQLDETLKRAGCMVVSSEKIHNSNNQEREKILTDALQHATLNFQEPFYFSLDCDVLDPEDFPGVATPVPNGLGFDALSKSLEVFRKAPSFYQMVRAVEIVEYCPEKDVHDHKGARKLVKVLRNLLF